MLIMALPLATYSEPSPALIPTFLRTNCPLRSRTKFASGRFRPNSGQVRRDSPPFWFGSFRNSLVLRLHRERAAISCRPRIGHSDQECL